MTAAAKQILAWLQLSRAGLMATAVSNIWLVALLSRALPQTIPGTPAAGSLPLWLYLLLTAAVACGLYAFGMTLNDLMDLRHDRMFAPQRPLPSRYIRPAAAMSLAVGALLIAVVASIPLGPWSVLLCVATATLVLFYDALGKHVPGVGILTLGTIRATHMLIANPACGFYWPLWLTLTHVIGLSALCHRLEEKRPRLQGGQVWLVTFGWALISLLLLGWAEPQGADVVSARPWIWAGPTALAITFAIWAGVTAVGAAQPRKAGMALMKRGLMWLILYDTAWLASAGLWLQALAPIALLIVTQALFLLIGTLKVLAEGSPQFVRRAAAGQTHQKPVSNSRG